MIEIFLLLFLFQVKHFVCDYPLQTQYMLGKMSRTGWVKPLAYHAATHAVGTLIVSLMFVPTLIALCLAIADFVLHFIVDRVKASPDLGGRWKPDQPYFWLALGADQMAHHLINYVFIYVIVTW